MITIEKDQQTIIAQCTPSGSGAIALLRICGNQAVEIASFISVLASGQKLIDQQTHTIHYGSCVQVHGAIIDHVMFFLMRGPKTFTGQDTVEITCHNNPFIIEEIITRAISCGARLAQEGEFTRRAVLNKKMDLIQAEAIRELIHANTQLALKKSLSQLSGSFSNWVTQIEQQLLKALALSEASFEFIDDEITFGQEIHVGINAVIDDINTIKKTFNQQNHIRNGIRIAIIGSVNAGKSSLFNSLLNRARAIVTPIPGTTRDVLEAGMYKQGTYITLLDTAGLRQTDDIIEQEGISRAQQEAQTADIILLVYDGSQLLCEQELKEYRDLYNSYKNKVIVVQNKADLAPADINLFDVPALTISTLTKLNIEKLELVIDNKIRQLFESIESPFLLNQRHYNVLLGLEKKLITLQSMLSGSIDYELVSYEIKDVLEELTELTGKTISEQGMDAVFKQFCVGK